MQSITLTKESQRGHTWPALSAPEQINNKIWQYTTNPKIARTGQDRAEINNFIEISYPHQWSSGKLELLEKKCLSRQQINAKISPTDPSFPGAMSLGICLAGSLDCGRGPLAPIVHISISRQ